MGLDMNSIKIDYDNDKKESIFHLDCECKDFTHNVRFSYIIDKINDRYCDLMVQCRARNYESIWTRIKEAGSLVL